MQNMQNRIKFPLTSEQCELLVAFESALSLADLAKAMHKDVSVISRNLQVLGETGVLQKNGIKWVLTALGRQVNHWTRTVAVSQTKIFNQQTTARFLKSNMPSISAETALILVGVQNGFEDPCWGPRNNLHAEENISTLLDVWRKAKRPVYHVQHQSKEPASPLRSGTMGGDFRTFATPEAGESVVIKSTNSSFVGTSLEANLLKGEHRSFVLVGFSTNHCIDATARTAGDLGFSVFIVSDACVAFDRVSLDGSIVKADDTQRVVMANLNQEFGCVIDTTTLLQSIQHQGGIGD
jgi:nicotinamidase-related amidase